MKKKNRMFAASCLLLTFLLSHSIVKPQSLKTLSTEIPQVTKFRVEAPKLLLAGGQWPVTFLAQDDSGKVDADFNGSLFVTGLKVRKKSGGIDTLERIRLTKLSNLPAL